MGRRCSILPQGRTMGEMLIRMDGARSGIKNLRGDKQLYRRLGTFGIEFRDALKGEKMQSDPASNGRV
jgi:hypothetical protein